MRIKPEIQKMFLEGMFIGLIVGIAAALFMYVF